MMILDHTMSFHQYRHTSNMYHEKTSTSHDDKKVLDNLRRSTSAAKEF